MLEKVRNKIMGTELEQRIEIHKCKTDRIGLAAKVDFVFLFYMVHEVQDQVKLFEELRSILNPGGRIYIIEPKFHVTKRAFNQMIEKTKDLGFEVIESPKVFFSRTVLLAATK
jgi:ubiquinone/menaquinone biosynthesis C-methylase UbiE